MPKETFNASERANEVVESIEQEWRKSKWAEYQVYSECDDGQKLADEVLDQVSEELTRLDPNATTSIDQEEVWRATGKYLKNKKD